MKQVKALFVLFGILGVVSIFLPVMEGFPSLFSADKGQALIMLVAFGIPLAVGAIALSKPPAAPGLAVAALAGFGLAAFKVHIWQLGPHIMDLPLSLKLMVGSAGAGLICAIVGLVKPEQTA